MSEDGTPLTNRDEPMPVESRRYPDEDPDGRTYHYYVRDLLEELNAHTVVHDAYANRQDYEPQTGHVFVPEEVDQPWAVGDGTDWIERDWTGAAPSLSSLSVDGVSFASKADSDGAGTAELTNYAALDTEETATGTLRAHTVDGGDNASLGMQVTRTDLAVNMEYVAANVLTGFDPDIYHYSHFDDGRYRFTITGSGNSNTDLYSAADILDPSTYTLEASEIFNSGSTDRRVNDHAVLSDGRFAVYVTDDDAAMTDVWVGESLTTLSNHGQVIDHNDCGVIRAPDGTIHIYPEDQNDTANARDSWKILHYTTPEDDLTNATDEGVAIDLNEFGWPGGDADVIQVAGTMYLFLDRDATDYVPALFRSDDYDSWQLVTEQLSHVSGGDLAVTKAGGELHGLTEQTEGTNDQIGAWRLQLHTDDPQFRARTDAVEWQWNATGIDEFTSGTSGSGNALSFDAVSSRAVLSTGTTSDSKSNAVKWLLDNFAVHGANQMSWRTNRTLTADIEVPSVGGEAFVVTGAMDDGARTLRHVGIGFDGSDIVGTVADGSNEDVTTLVSSASSGQYRFRVEFVANQRADFYVDGEKLGETATYLPTKANEAQRALMCYVANNSSTDRELRLYRARFGQAPDARLF